MRKDRNGLVGFKRLFLIAAIFPLMLVWGEVFTRTLFPQSLDSRMNIFAPDPIVGFTFKPYGRTFEKGREYNALYQINSLGLRDREYGQKTPGTFRILLLGDSFSVSHGLPIEESLSRQLESALQSLADLDEINISIEVVNASAGGYSPYNYWKAYNRWAAILKPDVVVVGLSPDDYDLSNAGMNYLIEGGATMAMFRDGEAPRKDRNSLVRKTRKWLSWNSQFYVLLRNYLYYNKLVGHINLWLGAKGEAQMSQLKQFQVPQPQSMADAWGQSFSYLDRLHQETSAHRVPLILIPIPLKLEIIPEEYRRALSASGLAKGQVDINQPMDQVSGFSRHRGIPLLDPRSALKAGHGKAPCYFIYDGHWNADGVRVAADSLAQQWRKLRISPWRNTTHASASGTNQ